MRWQALRGLSSLFGERDPARLLLVAHVHLLDGELRWGVDGAAHSFSDERTMADAFRKAVAEGVARGDTIEGVEERAVAQDLSARVLGPEVGASADIFAVTKDVSDARMIAYYPEGDLKQMLAGLYTGPGALAADDLHLTLLYLGDPDKDGSGKWNDDLVAAVTCLFAHQRMWRLDCQVTGLARFVTDTDTDCIVALVDSVDIAYMREQLKEALIYAGAIPTNATFWNMNHGFIPHITLGYVAKGTPGPNAVELTPFNLDTISYTVGGAATTYPCGYGATDEDARAEADVAFRASRDEVGLIGKAGRVLSGKNLAALQAAHEAMGKVIDAEAARNAKDETAKALVPDGMQYVVEKAADEQRYTFGPLYAPVRQDAHGEWTDPETLQKAVWDYVRSSDETGRRLNQQHEDSGESTMGEWVEICAWPYETTIKVAKSGEEPRDLVMPAGTVYMGVVWDEAAWPLVKSNKITGLSLGGRAVRVSTPDAADLPHMGDKLAAAKVTKDLHEYDGEDGGTCEVCEKSFNGGPHYGNASNPVDGE